MSRIITLLIILSTFNFRAQDLISSNTGVESCLDQQDCRTVNNVSYLFYDEMRNSFYLKVDFSNFRSDRDSLNLWINDLLDSTLYVRVAFPKESFPPLSNQSNKSFVLNGEVFFNGIIRAQNIEINIYNTENSLVISGNNNLKYDAYKINFSVPVAAKDFKVYKKLYYVNQTISINLNMGRINLLNPGMEFHLKEVYYQNTR
ncbi:MAG TPA: hypothetical protein PL029_06245 [Bacteroidia bacterium]|nr:hypothetical protein [Bacteroidia bacterium]